MGWLCPEVPKKGCVRGLSQMKYNVKFCASRSTSPSRLLEGLCFFVCFKMSGKMLENKLGIILLRVIIKTWNGWGLFRQFN